MNKLLWKKREINWRGGFNTEIGSSKNSEAIKKGLKSGHLIGAKQSLLAKVETVNKRNKDMQYHKN